jgi:hypothetical protein
VSSAGAVSGSAAAREGGRSTLARSTGVGFGGTGLGGGGGTSSPKSAAKLSQLFGLGFGRGAGSSTRRGSSGWVVLTYFALGKIGSEDALAPRLRARSSQLDCFSCSPLS